jgi:hypothetical protein
MGLWHGANWTFVLWGLHHATMVFAYRRISPRVAHWPARVRGIAGWAITLPLAMLGWVWFRATSLSDALTMFGKILAPSQYLALGLRESTYLVALLGTALVLLAWAAWRRPLPALLSRPVPRFAVYAVGFTVITSLVLVFLRPIQQFIYFQF